MRLYALLQEHQVGPPPSPLGLNWGWVTHLSTKPERREHTLLPFPRLREGEESADSSCVEPQRCWPRWKIGLLSQGEAWGSCSFSCAQRRMGLSVCLQKADLPQDVAEFLNKYNVKNYIGVFVIEQQFLVLCKQQCSLSAQYKIKSVSLCDKSYCLIQASRKPKSPFSPIISLANSLGLPSNPWFPNHVSFMFICDWLFFQQDFRKCQADFSWHD